MFLIFPHQVAFGEIDIQKFPIAAKVEQSGGTLSTNSMKWLKRFAKINLEDETQFKFKEISGTTSINIKIIKLDPEEAKGYKSYGSFVTLNESANPNSEIAYFNLSIIAGVDQMFRPTMRYELGKTARDSFKKILMSTDVNGKIRNSNKAAILKSLDKDIPTKGCIKAKKSDFSDIYDEMLKTSWFKSESVLKTNHPIAKLIVASNPQPTKGAMMTLKSGYTGDAYVLAKEFSTLLVFDAVFGQYDRFSGGNIVIEKDESGNAHFVGSDNGGAEIVDSGASVKKNLSYISRYDKKVISKLREIHAFLENPAKGFLGYTDRETFVVDLGLYFLKSPALYAEALENNIEKLLSKVHEDEERFGNGIYFEE
jgi:hypothetical protein